MGWLRGKISSRAEIQLRWWGWKKTSITLDIVTRGETGIGSVLMQKFLGRLCCSCNLHLPTCVNHLFILGWNFLVRWREFPSGSIELKILTWIAQTGITFQPGMKLSSCNCELRFSSIFSEGRNEISARLSGQWYNCGSLIVIMFLIRTLSSYSLRKTFWVPDGSRARNLLIAGEML